MHPARVRAALVLVALAVVAGACTQDGSSATDPPAAPAPPGAKLDHLIFIVQENRSFDHYFGTYPGADGIPTKPEWFVRGVRARSVAGRHVRPALRRAQDQLRRRTAR
jgi:phospholipase C